MSGHTRDGEKMKSKHIKELKENQNKADLQLKLLAKQVADLKHELTAASLSVEHKNQVTSMIESSFSALFASHLEAPMRTVNESFSARIDSIDSIQRQMTADWKRVADEYALFKFEFQKSEDLSEAFRKRMTKDKREFWDKVEKSQAASLNVQM